MNNDDIAVLTHLGILLALLCANIIYYERKVQHLQKRLTRYERPLPDLVAQEMESVPIPSDYTPPPGTTPLRAARMSCLRCGLRTYVITAVVAPPNEDRT